jgi:hypothetical protein
LRRLLLQAQQKLPRKQKTTTHQRYANARKQNFSLLVLHHHLCAAFLDSGLGSEITTRDMRSFARNVSQEFSET